MGKQLPYTSVNPEERFKEDITLQDLFNQVAYHLGTMRNQSRNGITCAYRSENGNNCCAAGRMIKDEEYYDSLEGRTISTILHDGDRWPARLLPHTNALKRLQDIHDTTPFKGKRNEVKQLLQQFARNHSLEYKILNHPDLVWNQ